MIAAYFGNSNVDGVLMMFLCKKPGTSQRIESAHIFYLSVMKHGET